MGTRLPKDHDHRITLDEAARLTRGQRREKDAAKRGMERPYALRREAFDGILSQQGCVGIRVYPAVHGDGSPTVVMVGIDEDGNDMVKGMLIQNVMDCPPFCPDSNQLNSDT